MTSSNGMKPLELLAIVRLSLFGGKIALVPNTPEFSPRSHPTSAAFVAKRLPAIPARGGV
jgi:hypothetical protein